MANEKNARQPERLHLNAKIYNSVEQLGCRPLLDDLEKGFLAASQVNELLRDCRFLPSISQGNLCGAAKQDGLWFLREFNSSVILALRGSARSIGRVIDGIAYSIGANNELLLALSIRAFLEHTGALNHLHSTVAPLTEDLRSFVRSSYQSTDASTVSLKAACLVLAKFNFGCRKQPVDPRRSNGTAVEEQLALQEPPLELRSTNAITFVQGLDRQLIRLNVMHVYELLCEYCHPNSSARSADLTVINCTSGNRFTTRQQDGMQAVRRLVGYASGTIPALCEHVVRLFAELSSPYSEMPSLPKAPWRIGSVTAIDQFGRAIQVDNAAAPSRRGDLAILTAGQRRRIEATHQVFSTVDGTSLDDCLALHAADGPFIEEELQLYEYLAKVFEDECQVRNSNAKEKRLLYKAILASSMIPSLDHLLSSQPDLKGLHNLSAVFQRVKQRV